MRRAHRCAAVANSAGNEGGIGIGAEPPPKPTVGRGISKLAFGSVPALGGPLRAGSAAGVVAVTGSITGVLSAGWVTGSGGAGRGAGRGRDCGSGAGAGATAGAGAGACTGAGIGADTGAGGAIMRVENAPVSVLARVADMVSRGRPSSSMAWTSTAMAVAVINCRPGGVGAAGV